MADLGRQFSWRQGDLLTGEAAVALGYCAQEDADATFIVVISHDCDLTAEIKKEPLAELIVGRRIDKLGGDSYGKTARRLHIEYQTQDVPVVLELMATAKQQIEKQKLFEFSPRDDVELDGRGIGILQRWLAARYHRAAFPEAFEDRLRAAIIPGKRTFLKKIELILSDGGEHIRGLLFDLDGGKILSVRHLMMCTSWALTSCTTAPRTNTLPPQLPKRQPTRWRSFSARRFIQNKLGGRTFASNIAIQCQTTPSPWHSEKCSSNGGLSI